MDGGAWAKAKTEFERADERLTEKGAELKVLVEGIGRRSFDANSWPSAEQISTLIREWNAARSALELQWNAIPEQIRKDMKPPPGIGSTRG